MLPLILTTRIDLLDAAILALPGVLAFVSTMWLHRKIKVPSGGNIGVVVDHTHTLAAGTSATTTAILSKQQEKDGTTAPPETDSTSGGSDG